jgi:diacylglycerol kinase (ATP)
MWLLVLNRKSGLGRVDRKVDKFTYLCRKNNVPYKIIDKSSVELTHEAIRKCIADDQISTVIAFGGDGLVSLCLQNVAESSIGLSVVPTGTGNDFARAIGNYGKSVNQVFSKIISTKPSLIDLGLAYGNSGRRFFVQVLSSGFDASVNELANQINYPIGKLKYTYAMLRKLPRFHEIDYEINTEAENLKIKSMLVAVANGNSYGGGMKILPTASYQDGELDLMYVDRVSKLTLLSIFPLVFLGWHLKHPAVHVLKAKEIELKGNTKAYADGEYVSNLPMQIHVKKDALLTWISP